MSWLLLCKALHIIFVVCWFAGIFYLPRLFVYHAMAEDENTRHTLAVMERKLYRFVTPFMILTIAFGALLLLQHPHFYFSQPWMLIKLVLVGALVVYHLYCGKLRIELANNAVDRGHVFFRWFNEIPVLMLFGIVILVVIKPF